MSRYGGEGSPGRSASRRSPGTRPAPGQRTGSRWPRIAGWIAVVLVAILVAGTTTAYLKIRSVYDSIGHVGLSGLGHRPPRYTSALNILVFGTDQRAGLSPHLQYVLHVGRNQGEDNTDTIMVLHISPGRGRVTVLSLPRDTMVPAYACPAIPGHPGQQADPSAQVQINSLFQIGGPSCLVKTVEQQTGIHLDHFIELGFAGFVKAVNDLGGVSVCLPFPVNDANSGLHLTSGPHHINGATALEFWRARYSIGNGSDLMRIQRDQYLLAQMLQGVLRKGLLSSPLGLLHVVRDVAGSMTTDSGMTQEDLLHIASSLSHISSANVQFVTAPNVPDPVQPARVVFEQPQARRVFSAIAHDRTLPRTPKASARGPAAPKTPTVKPSQVSLTVLNGSGVSGAASQAAAALASRGFRVLGTGDATTASGATDFSYTTSVIEYASPALLPAADTLSRQLRSVTLHQDPGLAPGTIELIVGSSFSSLAPPGGNSRPSGVTSLAREYGGITGNVSCTGDRAAWQSTG